MGLTLVAQAGGLKFQLTPEEHQILGLTPEDVASFSDTGIALTPAEIDAAIVEIIHNAYEKSPVFKKLVEEDAARDPSRLGRSSKVVAKFLKHLRGMLPPENLGVIKEDTFDQAHEMVRGVLYDKLKKPVAPAVAEPVIDPISDSELSLFNLTRDKLTAATKWEDVKSGVLYFLGKLRDAEGKLVKNEMTKGMPDDLKISVMAKLLNTIRTIKLQAMGGKLPPNEVNWLGKSTDQVLKIARALVVPAAPKDAPVYQNDLMEVNSRIVNILSRINSLTAMFTDPKFTVIIQSLTDVMDSALPSVSLFEDRIKSIEDEISKLGLTKSQIAALVTVDPEGLTYSDPVKRVLEDQKSALLDVNKTIKEKGETDDLKLKRTNIEKQIKQLEDISTKDTSGLKSAIDDYLDTLRVYKEKVKKDISGAKLDNQPLIQDFIRMVDEMALEFSRLEREELFKGRWVGRSGFVYRKDAPAAPAPAAPAPAAPAVTKEAASSAGYASKLEQFRGKGLANATETISDILGSSDKLPAIKEKLMSILELKPGNKLNDTGVDYSGNPLGGVGISLEDALKIVNKLRTLVKKINISDKGTEAMDVLNWAATLSNHIKGGKASKVQQKMAFAAYAIRKLARVIMGEEGKHIKYQSPANVGSDAPYKSPGKAGWIIFRERITKMGKKALESFFDEPSFVPDVVEEMEKAGLSNMLLHGGEQKPLDIDNVLEDVLRKATGKSGNLENILSTKVMQKFRTEFDIKKVTKEMEEASDRVKDLNTKITETESKYLPKLEEYGKFIKDPVNATREQIESLRGKEKTETEKKKEDTTTWTGLIKPEIVDERNYQSILHTLARRYLSSDFLKKLAAEVRKIAPSDTSKLIPSELMKRLLVWKKELKDMKAKVEKNNDPYKRAVALKDYYTHMVNVIERLSAYMEYQKKVILADEETLSRISAVLNSDALKNKAGKNVQLHTQILNSFKTQKDTFERIEKEYSNLSGVQDMAKEQLSTIEDDIADKKVEMIYQVAISPELTPDKQTAQRIKERAKEHEKGLSYIIDRSTYKNNMNRLMTYKSKRGPVEWSNEKTSPTALPPERKNDLEKSVRDFEDARRKAKTVAEYGMKQLVLKRMEEDIKRIVGIIDEGNATIEAHTALLENIAYLKQNKDAMPPQEYEKQMATLLSTTGGKTVDESILKNDIEKEKKYLEGVKEFVSSQEKAIKDLRDDIEKNSPAMDIKIKIQNLMSTLLGLRGLTESGPSRQRTTEDIVKLLEDKAERLKEMEKIDLTVQPGTPEEKMVKTFKTELKHQMGINEQELPKYKALLEREKKQQPAMTGVQAAIEDTMPDLSPYEKALETKGIKPAPFMQELPKPKGWELVENLFDEVKREHNFLRKLKEEGQDKSIRSDFLKSRLDKLDNMAEAIDAYKNFPVTIGGDKVVFRDLMMKFEETLSEYQQTIRKYINQRDDAVDRLERLKQEHDHLKEMFDPTTGDFKGFDKEETENLKGIFLRMLYRDMERYWSTKVGKDLSVFGDRDTDWYNNVFNTFKSVASTRSNKKMLGLVNRYKQETRSDFDDVVNRTKSQQLEKDRDALLEGYKSFDLNPEISSRLKDLNTRIETLKKQEKQIDRVFDFMGKASSVALQADFEKKLHDRAQELAAKGDAEDTVKKTKVDLSKKTDEATEEALDELDKNIPVLAENADEVAAAKKDLEEIKVMLPERSPVTEPSVTPAPSGTPAQKLAYDKNHRDFNLKILYGPHMQAKIAELMQKELNK
jgi:hypothetical protein